MADANGTACAMRRCTRCSEEWPATLDHFPPHKMGKYGLFPRCRPCKKLDDAERRARPDQLARQQAWRDANKEKVRETNLSYRADGYKSTRHVAEWRARNIEYCREYERRKMRRYREANPEMAREAMRRYYRKNREKMIARSAIAYRTNWWVNLKQKFSSRLRQMIRSKSPCSGSTRKHLGFTKQELFTHIERQFTHGMTWDRLLAGEIDIDHIVPVRAFQIREVGDAEFRACWSLGNLRPMWSTENRRKGGKVLTLL